MPIWLLLFQVLTFSTISYLTNNFHFFTLLFHISCKVEFYQPSCWLYSVPNLLVFQQLVTLYLGGILVREVSEIVWRNTQECARKTKTRDWISWVTRSWSVRHANSWSVMLVGALQDKIGQLAIPLSRGWNSQLSQVVSQPCFEKPDLSHSILTLVYIYPLYPWKKESF